MNQTTGCPAAEHIDYKGKKLGMWFFLCTELLFFGGMFLLYSVFRSRYPLDFHVAAQEEKIVLGSLNTLILLTSSLAIAVSVSAMKRNEKRLSTFMQVATIAMGIVFLVIKYFEWMSKISIGIYPNSPVLLQKGAGEILYFGLYYVMTGIHGVHVLVGVFVISFMVYFTSIGRITQANFTRLENTGLYWHFVDIVWIYLFPLFYLVT
jgi:cytochrome c oxidase subunit III